MCVKTGSNVCMLLHIRAKSSTFVTKIKIASEMIEEEERLTPFERFRERHERFDLLCEWLECHWEDVVLYVLSAVILVLIAIFMLIMCSA